MLTTPAMLFRLPAVRFLAAFAAGILAAAALDWSTTSMLFLLPLPFGLGLHLLLRRRCEAHGPGMRRILLPLPFLLLAFIAGALHVGLALRSVPTGLLRFADRGEDLTLSLRVTTDGRRMRGRQRFEANVDTIWTKEGSFALPSAPVLCFLSAGVRQDGLPATGAGDRLRLTGSLLSARGTRNPGQFDYRAYLRSQGLTTVLQCRGAENVQLLYSDAASPLRRIRAWTAEGITRLFQEDDADIMRGLLLGDRGMIRDDVMDSFRNAGVVHILAVSGLHAGILLAMVMLPLQRLRYPFRVALALLLLWTFASLTGWAPPVMRASLMATVLLGAHLLQRSSSSENALAASGLCILLLDPLAIFQVSFQLSFLAVLSILLFHGRMVKWMTRRLPALRRLKPLQAIVSLFLLTVSAQVGTLPLMAMVFGEVSIISLVSNLLVVPLVFVVVSAGLLGVVLQSAATLASGAGLMVQAVTWLAGSCASSTSAALGLIVNVSTFFGSLTYATVRTLSLPWWSVGVYLIVLLLLARRGGGLLQRIIIATLAGIAATVLCQQTLQEEDRDTLRVHFIDVGQGDAVLLELPGGGTVLIDAGDAGERFDAGRDVVVPYLQRLGIDELQALVLTHPDGDHIGGAGAVLDAIQVRRVITACDWPETEHTRTVAARIAEEGSGRHDLRAGDTLAVHGDIRLYVLSPGREEGGPASNNNSVVLLLHHGETGMLFTGDAEVEAEQEMVDRYGAFLDVDVLKIGHHGSTTSSSSGFIATVMPRLAVISCGRGNRFGHPKEQVLTRLRARGAEILRTDIEGAIILESDGIAVGRVHW